MRAIYIGLIAALVLAFRLVQLRRRRRVRSSGLLVPAVLTRVHDHLRARRREGPAGAASEVAQIAKREIKERVQSRIFRVGTLIILAITAAAIVIPNLHGTSRAEARVGVVGSLSRLGERELAFAAVATRVHLVQSHFRDQTSVRSALRAGRIDVAVLDGSTLEVNGPLKLGSSNTTATFVVDLADRLGLANAYVTAGLTSSQVQTVSSAEPLPIRELSSQATDAGRSTSVVGLVLMFLMLSQYCTWILMGVMQEKASRVVEVLLATVRPLQLLAGKVLGIGLVALSQAGLVVATALLAASAVGSDLLKGSGISLIFAELLWLVLGYGFYCWLYAAVGSTAERQDQVQTLALPLAAPTLVGYVFSITALSSANASAVFKVLAYLPPTAPFAMSALVGLHDVTWWQFFLAVLISLAATVATARVAAVIYRRAVLQTGARVRLNQLLQRRQSSTRAAS